MVSIYKITNTKSGRCYVGHTTMSAQQRWVGGHRYLLRKGTHPNQRLQNAWNKYGEVGFVLTELEICPDNLKLVREQHHIDRLNPYYNIARVAGSRLGVPQPESVKLGMAGNKRGAKTRTAETCARISYVQKNRTWQPMKGRYHSPETRAKIKASNKANKSRRHVGMSGKSHSPESKERMRQAKLGRVISEETRAKMRSAHARRLAA